MSFNMKNVHLLYLLWLEVTKKNNWLFYIKLYWIFSFKDYNEHMNLNRALVDNYCFHSLLYIFIYYG